MSQIYDYLNFDFSLLQGKLQKHQAFEAEISAHSLSMVELQETGEGMINESHYASDLIRVKYHENVFVS